MANASDDSDTSIRVMEEDLSCNICYNLLREPKDLDCPHVFCLECLKKCVGKQPDITCPECRHITTVPQGGLNDLKTDLRLKNLIDRYRERLIKQERLTGAPLCPNHSGERQYFYCITCSITVCHNCLVLEHPRPKHEINELKNITRTQKEDIKARMERVHEEMKEGNEDKIKLESMKGKLRSAAIQAQRDVQNRYEEVVADAAKQRQQMIAGIKETCEQRIGIFQERENLVINSLINFQNVLSATQNVIDTAPDHEYMDQHAALINKIDQICVSKHDMPSEDFATIRFNPGSGPMNQSGFGEVLTSCERPCKLTLVTEFGNFEHAQGVATNQRGLVVVVDSDADELITFQIANARYKRHSFLSAAAGSPGARLTKPRAVTSTSEGRLLISDDGLVKVFSQAGIYERSWPKPISIGRITTTPDDMVVIANSAHRVVTVHKCNGELIRKHRTDCKNMQDIASNGKQIAFTQGSKGKVFVIDFVTGQTIRTWNMEWPSGICYEPKSDTLLIAGGSKEKGRCVIEQYCSTTGRLISRVASGLYNPLTMTVTLDNKLVVADTNTVKIYCIE